MFVDTRYQKLFHRYLAACGRHQSSVDDLSGLAKHEHTGGHFAAAMSRSRKLAAEVTQRRLRLESYNNRYGRGQSQADVPNESGVTPFIGSGIVQRNREVFVPAPLPARRRA